MLPEEPTGNEMPPLSHRPEIVVPGQGPDDFRRLLQRLTPRVFVTRTLWGLNIAVFAGLTLLGVNLFQPTTEELIRWGGNFGPKSLGGQPWRLVSSMFLHAGILHLVFNMWVLWDVGRLVERFVGNLGFLLAYMISGVAGSLASAWWHPHLVSLGASGAVFGLFGVLLGFVALGRGSIPADLCRGLRGSVLSFLVFNLLLGFSVPGIDMAAHLGGLVAGFVAGMILAQPLNDSARSGRIVRNLALAACGLAGLGLAWRAMAHHL